MEYFKSTINNPENPAENPASSNNASSVPLKEPAHFQATDNHTGAYTGYIDDRDFVSKTESGMDGVELCRPTSIDSTNITETSGRPDETVSTHHLSVDNSQVWDSQPPSDEVPTKNNAIPVTNSAVGNTESNFPLSSLSSDHQVSAPQISDNHDTQQQGGSYSSSPAGILGRMAGSCSQNFSGHMGMMSNQGSGYDMASSFHHTGYPTHLNRHHHLLGTPSASLIPLAAPNNYMRMQSGYAAASSQMNSGGGSYTLLPASSTPSFYYDYASLSRQQQQAAAAAAAAATFQRSSDPYGGGSGNYCSGTLSLNGGSGGINIMNTQQNHVVTSREATNRFDISSQSPFTGQPPLNISANQSMPSSTAVSGNSTKRPRGRPRKHPLPVPQQLHQMFKPSAMTQGGQGFCDDGVSQLTGSHSTDASNPIENMNPQTDSLSQLAISRRKTSRASRCLKSLQGLFSTYTLNQIQMLDASHPQMETAEEYIAIGGPFARIAMAVALQLDDFEYDTEQSEVTAITGVETAGETSIDALCDKILRRYPKESDRMSVSLNKSFVWASLDPKVPVRDLTLSRHHMAALLNDSRIFVYRHKTHPLVCSRVDDWEHVAGLDNCGIVAVRVASALLPENWREKFHNSRRPHIIARVRRELSEAGIELPPTSNGEEITTDELKLYIANHPDGALCCSSDMLDPDWLPEPFVLAALGHTGIVRVAKCGGYYNYPMLVKPEETNAEGEHITDGMEEEEESTAPATASNNKQIQYKLVSLDKLDKHPSLTVPTKELDESGKPIKAVAQIQDLALGELTFASFLSPASPASLEPSMVLYAVGNSEHSAFVKGRNLYIRFKNFPTGPAKLHCSPLGHTGAVLLANGSVWSWSTTSKQPAGSEKVGAVINQVEGSLAGRVAVDLVAVGAEFMALTSDGVVHEWNCYEPYSMYGVADAGQAGDDMVIPQSSHRPYIPQAVEYTPDFQKKILARVHQTTPTRPTFKVGQFSWFGQKVNSSSKPAEADTLLATDDKTNTQPISDAVNVVNSTVVADTKQNVIDSNYWDFGSEEILEWHRQQEIKARYISVSDNKSQSSSDPVERIYLTEGITMFLRASSNRFEAIANDLAVYRSIGGSWIDSTEPFNMNHAKTLIKDFGDMGKPIVTNPVVIARMKLPRDLTDEQLRSQLEQMAGASPPTYRLLVSPSAVVIAILRRIDLVEEAKRMLTIRVPIPIAAFDPKLYLEAFTGLSPIHLTLLQTGRTGKRQMIEDYLTESSDGGRDRKEGGGRVGRRSRGRVGRPRGSRAGLRASLSCRVTSAGSRSTDVMEDATAAPPTMEPDIESTADADPASEVAETIASSGTRKRNRRQSAVLDEQQFFTGFADSDDSEKAWEHALQMMDGETDDDGKRKKKKSRNKKRGRSAATDDIHLNTDLQQLPHIDPSAGDYGQATTESSYYQQQQQQQAYQQAYNSIVLQVGTPAAAPSSDTFDTGDYSAPQQLETSVADDLNFIITEQGTFGKKQLSSLDCNKEDHDMSNSVVSTSYTVSQF